MSIELDFSELLIAKFCHDISGLVSAISHSTEFLDGFKQDTQLKAQDLLQTSSNELMAKLRCYRYSYGVGPQTGENEIRSVKEMLDASITSPRVKLNWKQDHGVLALTHKTCKLLVNMVLVTVNALIYGGEIEISLNKDECTKKIKVTGNSNKEIKLDPNFKEIISQPDTVDLNIKNIQLQLMARLALSMGIKLNASATETSCSFFVEI